jgi:hypothetical protein
MFSLPMFMFAGVGRMRLNSGRHVRKGALPAEHMAGSHYAESQRTNEANMVVPNSCGVRFQLRP